MPQPTCLVEHAARNYCSWLGLAVKISISARLVVVETHQLLCLLRRAKRPITVDLTTSRGAALVAVLY